MIRRLGFYSAVTALLGLIFLMFYYIKISSWGSTPRNLTQPISVNFPKGTKLDELSGALEAAGVIDNALNFKLWVKMFGNYARYQAGQYRFSGQVAPSEIDRVISSGKSFVPVVLQIVIPEGFTLKQVIKRYVANGVGDEKSFNKLVRDQEFMRSQNIVAKSLEGYLYPATYNFVKKPTPSQALSKMIATFWENLPQNYLERIRKKNLTLTEAVTFASLIEMETTHADEMNMISEVIWNRLGNQEPLGIDASLIYGIKDYSGDIKWKHLRDKKNLYNTRIHKGLPPGPIGAVSSATLEAVLNPTTQGYYYYVLKSGTTRHYFSKTLSEHNKYVNLLLKEQN